MTQQSHSTTPGASNAPTTPETSPAQGSPKAKTKKQTDLEHRAGQLAIAVRTIRGASDLAVADKVAREHYRAAMSVSRVGEQVWADVRNEAVRQGWLEVRPDGALYAPRVPGEGGPQPSEPVAPIEVPPSTLPGGRAPSPGIAQRAKELRTALENSRTGSLPGARVVELCGGAHVEVTALAVNEGWLRIDATTQTVELVELPPEPDSHAADVSRAELGEAPPRSRLDADGLTLPGGAAHPAVPIAAAQRLASAFACVVLVDCLAVGPWPAAEGLRAAPAIARAIRNVEARESCPVDLVGYGKGPAMVVADLRGVPVCDPGIWLADARDPVLSALLPVLLGAGAVIVRGVR